MTARSAPYFPRTATGDGTTKTFALTFPLLAAAHLVVILNGVLQTLNTHYTLVDITSPTPSVKFVTAPTNAYAIKFYRSTPIEKVSGNPEISQLNALQAFYRSQELSDRRLRLPFYFNATDLATPTAQSIVAPCDGFIEGAATKVVDAAISTGGSVTVEVDTVAVTGLTVVVANSAAIGVINSDTPTTAQSSTTQVRKGQTITVTPGAAFNGGGALEGYVDFQPGDLT